MRANPAPTFRANVCTRAHELEAVETRTRVIRACLAATLPHLMNVFTELRIARFSHFVGARDATAALAPTRAKTATTATIEVSEVFIG